MSLAPIQKNVLIRPTEPTEVRDDRFRNILRRQFGDHGIAIMASQGFIFMLIIIFIITIVLTTALPNTTDSTLFTFGKNKTATPRTAQPMLVGNSRAMIR